MFKTPVSVLGEFLVKKGIPAPKYQYYSAGPPHNMCFTCYVKAGSETAVGVGSTKLKSKHDAARNMLGLLGVKLDNQPQVRYRTGTIFTFPDSMLKTPVSILEEFRVKIRIAAPEYDYYRTGPGMTFTCHVKAGGKTAVGVGSTKKESKHDAARNMLSLFGIEIDNQPQQAEEILLEEDDGLSNYVCSTDEEETFEEILIELENLWKEVYTRFDGKYTTEELKKKWEHIKDKLLEQAEEISSEEDDGSAYTAELVFEEVLIELVQNRPPLWDCSIPRERRSVIVRKNLWKEVYTRFDGKYTVEELKKKWKYLKDQYIKNKAEIKVYILSGSQQPKNKVWICEKLKFWADSVKARKYYCVSDNATIYNSTQSNYSDYEKPSTSNRRKSNRSKQKGKGKMKAGDNQHEIIDTISLSRPLLPNTSEINPVLQEISEIMETLPPHKKANLEKELLEKAYQYFYEDSDSDT